MTKSLRYTVRVQQIANATAARGGGYANKADDLDATDVRLLPRAQAVGIFIRHYFDKPRITLLLVELQPSVFDMFVNPGSNAVKILQ